MEFSNVTLATFERELTATNHRERRHSDDDTSFSTVGKATSTSMVDKDVRTVSDINDIDTELENCVHISAVRMPSASTSRFLFLDHEDDGSCHIEISGLNIEPSRFVRILETLTGIARVVSASPTQNDEADEDDDFEDDDDDDGDDEADD